MTTAVATRPTTRVSKNSNPPKRNTNMSEVAIKNTFGGVFRSEWIKLTSLRSVRVTILLTFLAGAGLSLLGALSMSTRVEDVQNSSALVEYLLLGPLQVPVMFLSLLFGVLGVFAFSSEYSSGMILSTLAATPNRGRVFTAKALAVTVLAVLTAIATLSAGQLLGIMVLPESAQVLTDPTYLLGLSGAMIFLIGMVLLAYGIAGILRSTAGGITVMTALTFVLPIILGVGVAAGWAWIGWVHERLPMMLAGSLINVTAPNLESAAMSWPHAALTVLAWVAIAVIPAAILFQKRDAR